MKRRLHIVADLVAELRINVDLEYVTEQTNRGDVLTSVLTRWLQMIKEDMVKEYAAAVAKCTNDKHMMILLNHYYQHHVGVDSTLALTKECNHDLQFTKEQGDIVVSNACHVAQLTLIWSYGRKVG
ncbi:hypothetical protein GJ496_003801 [Pomphorhynchus laevis]|nr:hypothetical protein GJ496_003801 [Pomphorhynchus laevis]